MSTFLVVAECAIEHNGNFLMITRPKGGHAGGLLAFPGGKVEQSDGSAHNNILIKTVKREVQEEVGLDLIDPIHFITSSYFVDTSTLEPVLDAVFYCKINTTLINIQASAREVAKYQWLSADEIFSHEDSPPWLKNYLNQIINSAFFDKA